MKYIILFALLFMLAVSCGLQYAPAEQPEPIETPEPIKAQPQAEVIPVISEPTPTPVPTPEPTIRIAREDAEYIAKTLYGEYRGEDKLQQAGVVWCILNRCDAWDMSVEEVVTAPGQFHGYNKHNPVLDYLLETTIDVMTRWEREKLGEVNVGRVLPKDYLWFGGNGTINRFRNAYEGGTRWDWSLESPYEEAE